MFKLVQNHKVLYFISLILIVSYSVVDLLKSILMSYIFDDHLLDSISSLIVIVLVFLGVYLIVSSLQQYVVEVLKNKIRYSLNKNLYQSYASRNIESLVLRQEKGLATSVGDEGGFAPDLKSDEEAIEYILKAIEKAGYQPEKDFMLAMDAASSEWKGEKKGEYILPKAGTKYTSNELIEHWKKLVDKYPIISIEDALDEEDWKGWQVLTKELGDKVQLVGDDLFVTNTERLGKGIELGCGNSILIKLNQIGSVSETLEAIKMAHKAGYTAISSHRSGETEDTTIADLAVALNTCQIKTGAPSRTERVTKYNQLLRIEEELKDAAVYPGMAAFNVKR